MGMYVDEARLRPRDLERANEAFLTNALIEVLPVNRVGASRIGQPGPVTRALASAYQRLTESP